MSTTPAIPEIIDEDYLSPAQLRYWHAKARKLGERVRIIDPWRHSLKWLRENGFAGVTVYRASTGGKWGKSAAIVAV